MFFAIYSILQSESPLHKIPLFVDKPTLTSLLSLSCFALFSALVLIITRNSFVRKKVNAEIMEQREAAEQQHAQVESHRQEILDSIIYARRLQHAILPPVSLIRLLIRQSFVLYKPKAIVAGDFYWIHTHRDSVYIAAADCTGHGVPGALVSIICHSALNRAVNEFCLTNTGQILDKATEIILECFEYSGEEIKDGMDISLLCIDKSAQTIQWSGANNPLWIINENGLKEINPNKQPVGKSHSPAPFSSHTFDLVKGDSYYLITDGYADQFGLNGKKLMKKKFKELLLSVRKLGMSDQHNFIDDYLEKWKGDSEQTDDITVIGIKI